MESKKLPNLSGVRKGAARLVGDLSAREKAERNAYEVMRKRRLRARGLGETDEKYDEHANRRGRAESVLRAGRDSDARSERMKELHREFEKDRLERRATGPGPASGRSLGDASSKAFAKARLEAKGAAKRVTADDWDRMVGGDVGKSAMKGLEIVEDYKVFEGSANRWYIEGGLYRDPELFMDRCRPLAEKEILDVPSPKKVSIVLSVRMVKIILSDSVPDIEDTHAFRSGVVNIPFGPGISGGGWNGMVSAILSKVSRHQSVGSGWVLLKIEKLFINVDRYNSLDTVTGHQNVKPRKRPPPADYSDSSDSSDSELSGSSWIPLPETLGRGSVINLKNKGNDCFPLSVAAAIALKSNPELKNLERVPKTLRASAKDLDMGDIQMPVKIGDIPRFEELNPHLRIVVYGVGYDNKVVPVYGDRCLGDSENNRSTLILFFWGDGNGNYHYSPVKNFSSLITMQRLNSRMTHTCHNCKNVFGSKKILDKHEADGACYENECQKVELVREVLKFKDWQRSQTVPYAIYSDSESFSIPIPPQDTAKNTTKILRQTPSGLGYCVVGPPGTDPWYRSFDTVEEYLLGLTADVRTIYRDFFVGEVAIDYKPGEKAAYGLADTCYQCGCLMDCEDPKSVKNPDHDHFTGEYRGAACMRCNTAMKKPRFIPVYFHNFEGYDSHLIVQELERVLGDVSCISRGAQKYISFSVKIPVYPDDPRSPKFEIRFLDSLKLLGSGLSNLVSAIGMDDMHITRSVFPNMTDRKLRLLRRKGVYPYEWMDCEEKLERIGLPPISDFYNRLTDSHCSKEDYVHAQMVWCEFDCATMQDYHDTYMMSDICQLADVTEKFRKTCRSTYGLDPPWYYTAPGLSWSAMLKITGVELDTIPDPDMHLLIDRCIRGGISVITKRHSEANHKYMLDYDPRKPSKFIAYYDMNNLYGKSMVGPLPRGDLRWMSQDEILSWKDLVGHNVGDDTGTGCYLEVDVEYPDNIHDLHSDYPMMSELMHVGESDVKKLVPNLSNKTKYVIHHDELRYCIESGLILRKIHRGLAFSQSKWMKKYIDLNTDMRAKSTSKSDQDLYKLMNNSVYGKTIEGVRDRRDIRLTSNISVFRKLVAKDEYIGRDMFPDGRLMEVELSKRKAKLDKPRQVGGAVLSSSKVEMCKFFYGYMKPKWGDKVGLLSTDTDSFIMEVHTEDFYSDIAKDVEARFDTSNIKPDNLAVTENLMFKVGVNKRVLGMMKDEAEGANVVEFVGLRSKSNAVRMEGDGSEDVKKCKGVKRYVSEGMTFQEYKDCLFTREPVYKTQSSIRNRNNEIYVERMTKKALCGEDDKRFIMENRIDTLPWGHYSLR